MSEILRTEKVCRYFGGLKAVDNISMSVNSGQIFGIIGPNGAGKTTFFNVCSGIYKPTKGNVYFEGRDISGLKPEVISRLGITRTFQAMQLFKYMTVLENVKVGCHKGTKAGVFDAMLHTKSYRHDEEYVTKKSIETIERAGLSQYTYTLAGNLPYGVQRKVEIARALATDPKILLLDEPAAGMNPMETEELRKFVQDLNKDGLTIVLIEHDMKFVMNCCHNILVLNFGKKICEGTPEEVKNDKEVQVAYFGSGMIGKEVQQTC